MASTASDDFEKDWTFVDRDGKIDIQVSIRNLSCRLFKGIEPLFFFLIMRALIFFTMD